MKTKLLPGAAGGVAERLAMVGRVFLLLLALGRCALGQNSPTNAPLAEWQKNLGGSFLDRPNTICQTSDGGFLVGGFSYSTNGTGNKTSPNYGLNDYWIIRLDAKGSNRWDQSFGGSSLEQLYGVAQMADGGFLLAGNSYSDANTGNKNSTNYGGSDIWIVRINTNGVMVSQTTYGGSGTDGVFNLKRTSDGGFVVAGYSSSTNVGSGSGNKTAPLYGGVDYWVLRLDGNGNKVWENSYGGSNLDYLYDIAETPDGGFVLGGWSSSEPGGNKSAALIGGSDFWLVRINAAGTKLWDRSYGGTNLDQLIAVCANTTNSFVLAGTSGSGANGNKTTGNFGGTDYWVVGVDLNGNIQWQKSFGGTSNETVFCAQAALDGEVVIGGTSLSGTTGNKTGPALGKEDMWLVRLDQNGTKLWDQTYGGNDEDQLYTLAATEDGGLILGGFSRSNPNLGVGDFAVHKLMGEPVIFIPGIAASDLYSATTSEQLWLTVLPAKILRLSLDPTEPRFFDEIYARDVSRSFDPGIPLTGAVDIYGTLISFLTDQEQGNYREYLVGGDPTKRTAQGMDFSQLPQRPTLFPLAYDWRLSNVQTAAKLKDYVDGIRRFYPGTKVNIIAHSMGGLVAKRYILDHPGNHHVRKMVTIGTPFLGAPVAIYRLERGRFFGSLPDLWTSDETKDVMEFFPGVHELLPSQAYFNLAGDNVYEERGADMDGDFVFEENYAYADFVRVMDQRFRSQPGTVNRQFHTTAQDDLSPGASDVKGLQICGRQSGRDTVGKIEVFSDVDFAGQINTRVALHRVYTYGDQTVPLLSSHRASSESDRADSIVMRGKGWSMFHGPGRGDSEVEHTALTQNPRVQKKLLDFLRGKQETGTATVLDVDPETEMLYVDIAGVDFVQVSDSLGHTNTRLNELFALAVPGVDYSPAGSNAVALVMPATEPYTLAFVTSNAPMRITIVRGFGNETPNEATRYLDLVLPTNVAVRLTLATNSPPALAYDADGNGTFETPVAPTVFLTGAAAADTSPPTLQLSAVCTNQQARITLTATDAGAGVASVYYSFDAVQATAYTGAFTISPTNVPVVYAFATDLAGNRTSLLSLSLRPRLEVVRTNASAVMLSWPDLCLGATLQQSPSLSVPNWTVVTNQLLLQSNRYFVVLPTVNTARFFRLSR